MVAFMLKQVFGGMMTSSLPLQSPMLTVKVSFWLCYYWLQCRPFQNAVLKISLFFMHTSDRNNLTDRERG